MTAVVASVFRESALGYSVQGKEQTGSASAFCLVDGCREALH